MTSAGDPPGAQPTGLPNWPGIDEEAVATTCSVIARRLSLVRKKSIGVLPVAGSHNLGPFIVRIAAALARFAPGRVGVIPRWRSWAKDPGGEGETAGVRLRAMGQDVVVIVPAAAADSRGAALALQPAMWELPPEISHVLVDLSGYAKAGAWPGTGVLVDCVLLAVPRKVARRDRVASLLRAIPEGKSLGAVLVG